MYKGYPYGMNFSLIFFCWWIASEQLGATKMTIYIPYNDHGLLAAILNTSSVRQDGAVQIISEMVNIQKNK